MEKHFKYTLLIFLLVTISKTMCQKEEAVPENVTEANVIAGPKNATEYKLPDEILEHYAQYDSLEEYNNTCSYENAFYSFNEKKLEEQIKRDQCIPNYRTLQLILDAGWIKLTEYLVKEVYLPKLIDPTNIIHTYLNKYEGQSSKLKYLNANISQYDSLHTVYTYENYENSVKILITLPDASYVLEYLSVYCYKDLLKINGIFKARHTFFRVVDTKRLFDSIEGECDYNYNSFNNQIEISLNKLNKLKKWTSLFKH